MSRSRTYFLLVLGIPFTVTLLSGQSPSNSGGHALGAILVDTDEACRLSFDGQDKGTITPEASKKIAASLGEHVLKCTIPNISELSWRKSVEVKDSKQIAVLISLKALFIQYSEAKASLTRSNGGAPRSPDGTPSTGQSRLANAAPTPQESTPAQTADPSSHKLGIQPFDGKQGEELGAKLSIDDTMKFIQTSLNNVGKVAFVANMRDSATNQAWKSVLVTEETQVIADSNQCRISDHAFTWVDGRAYESNGGFPLRPVQGIETRRYEEYMKEVAGKAGQSSVSVESTSQPITVVLVHIPTQEDQELVFADTRLADRVARALTHASSLCQANSEGQPTPNLSDIQAETLSSVASHSAMHGFNWIDSVIGIKAAMHIRISRDGSTLLLEETSDGSKITRNVWSEAEGLRSISSLGLDADRPTLALSADGSEIVAEGACKCGVTVWKKGNIRTSGFDWRVCGIDDAESGSVSAAMSADGSVIASGISEEVGKGKKAHFVSRFYRLRQLTESEKIAEAVDAAYPFVIGVSDDGSAIVGGYFLFNGFGAIHYFRWTKASGLEDLGDGFYPSTLSSDGSSIVGMHRREPSKFNVPVIWTSSEGVQDIGFLSAPAGKRFVIFRVSEDMSVSAGALASVDDKDLFPLEAYVWTKTGGLQVLGTLGGKTIRDIELSSDGSTVAGIVAANDGSLHAFVSKISLLPHELLPSTNITVAQQLQQDTALANQQAGQRALQPRIDSVLAGGHPAQIYALAGDLEEENHPELAASLYQTLIDRYPDDPYAARAIERREAARAAAKKAEAERTADLKRGAQQKADHEQSMARCQTVCTSGYNACRRQVAQAKQQALLGALSGSLGNSTSGVIEGLGEYANAKSDSDCAAAYNNCNASCQ